MLSALLLTAFAAGPTLAKPDLVLHAPQVRNAAGVERFLERAGARAPILRDSQALVVPLLGAEALDHEALTRMGIRAAGSFTSSIRGGAALACFQVAEPTALDAALGERLARLGPVDTTTRPGTQASQRLSQGRNALAGWVRRGARACTWSAPVEVAEPVEREAVAALRRPADVRAKASGIEVRSAQLRGRIEGDAEALTFRGQGNLRRLPPLGRAGRSPYVGTKAGGTAQALVRLAPGRVDAALHPLLRRSLALCGSCPRGQARVLSQQLGTALTGNAIIRAGTFRPTGAGLRSDLGRFRALPVAMLFELRSGVEPDALLQPFGKLPGAVPVDGGFRLPLAPNATLTLAVRGGHLSLSTAEALGEALYAALPEAPGQQAHALELTADPRAIASALRRIPLLESLADPALAGLVVISNTVGPLLAESLPLTLHADPLETAGRMRIEARWGLAP